MMKKVCVFAVCAFAALSLVGCASTLAPTYQATLSDQMRIGGDMPEQKEPQIINGGSYCLQVTDKWKSIDKTPDGQKIWTKDTFRKAVPCH